MSVTKREISTMLSNPRVLKELKGAGKLYDFRGTGHCPGARDARGRYIRINPLIAVEHIPVVRDQPGWGDFATLGRVLRDQGLHLQFATDREGNVCIYNDANVLCYQARGANQVSCGVEHMHMGIHDPWTKMQLRASGWIWQYLEREYGIPMQGATLTRGSGKTARVVRKGHCSHERVSSASGYNDRSDPGPKYDWEYVLKCAKAYKYNASFVGV